MSDRTEPNCGNAVAAAGLRYKSTVAIVTMTSSRNGFYTSGQRVVVFLYSPFL